MTEQNLTDWFPDSIEPVRSGVYEIRFPTSHDRLYSRWHKGIWRSNSTSKSDAAKSETESFFAKTFCGQMQWRGKAK